jgi:chromosome segregation ATPase
MAEGSETPGSSSGSGAQSGGLGPEGRGRGTEGDLLAERRARRAVESGDAGLIRRAEAAEATVRTLEAHVASLQQRLREAEVDARRISELVEGDQTLDATPAAERRPSAEQELRRAKQREYAEQQLRVEAEDRHSDLERESALEIERLGRRLSASERSGRALTRQLESVQRELAEAEQAAAAELAAVRRAEGAFQARLAELERRAVEIHGGLEAERAARERSERLLESMRLAHRRMVVVVRELMGVVAKLRAARLLAPTVQTEPRSEWLAHEEPSPRRQEPAPASWSGPGRAHREEMTEALAAAVERLRARVEDEGDAPVSSEEARACSAVAASPLALTPQVKRPPHRHTRSWLARRSIRRKERRAGPAAAAQPPSMQSQ